MKRSLLLCVILFFGLLSCTKDRPRPAVPPPATSGTFILPKTKGGQLPRPYLVNGKRYYPLPDSHGFLQYGKASWYGKKFHGRKTAGGEPFDMYGKTAAHKTLPLNTFVNVTNLSNSKSVIVRINDRGPFVKERVIDLSYGAAREIGLVGPGTADVRIIALAREVNTLRTEHGTRPIVEAGALRTGNFTIQVGAFRDRNNALALADRLGVIYKYVNVTLYKDESGRTFYRVRVSKSTTLDQAGRIEKKLEDMGLKGAFIVRI